MIRTFPTGFLLLAAALSTPQAQGQNQAAQSAIASGVSNSIATGANYSFIGSGWRNSIRANGGGANGMSLIGSGQSNTVGASWSVINGGFLNAISPNSRTGQMSFIGSGGYNLIDARYAVIAGGYSNRIASNATGAVISGGYTNTNNAPGAVIAGGFANTASGSAIGGAIGGGNYNTVSAPYGTVPGGFDNIANGSNSLAAGAGATANHAGAFVWADMSTNTDFVSTSSNQFLIRAQRGVGINTNNPGTNSLWVNGSAKITGNLTAGSINGQAVSSGNSPSTIVSRNAAGNFVAGTITATLNGNAASATTAAQANTAAALANARTISLIGDVAGVTGPFNGSANVIAATTIATGAVNSAKIADGSIVNVDISPSAAIAGSKIIPIFGVGSTAAGMSPAIGGGTSNTVSGNHATIPGGTSNAATNQALAAGTRAKATNTGAFVWADASTNADFGSRASNQFLIRAAGGVGINTNDPGTNALSVNGTVQIGIIQVVTGGGSPTAEAPDGSIYLNNQGKGPNDTLWFRAGGKWYQVFGYLPSPSPEG